MDKTHHSGLLVQKNTFLLKCCKYSASSHYNMIRIYRQVGKLIKNSMRKQEAYNRVPTPLVQNTKLSAVTNEFALKTIFIRFE